MPQHDLSLQCEHSTQTIIYLKITKIYIYLLTVYCLQAMFPKLSHYLIADILPITAINNLLFTTANNTSTYIHRKLHYLLTLQIFPSKQRPPTCWDMDTGDADNTTLCRMVQVYQYSGSIYCLNTQGRMLVHYQLTADSILHSHSCENFVSHA